MKSETRHDKLKSLQDWGFQIREEKNRFFVYFNGHWYDQIGGTMGYKSKKGAEDGLIKWYEKPA